MNTSRAILTERQIDRLARPLAPIIRQFYENEDNVQAYREWYYGRFGHYPEATEAK